MPFLIDATDREGQAETRQRVRPDHLAYLGRSVHMILAAGAKLSDDGSTPLGSFYLVDLEERAAAQAFIGADPYMVAGVFGDVRLTRVRKGFFDGAQVAASAAARAHFTAPAATQVAAPAAAIVTASSSATAPESCRGNVLVSGSYGGEYNAFHAAKRPLRGVILNDAGVGKDGAGISGLAYLDRIGLPAATADARTCHIGDGDDMLAHGVISHVNAAAARLGCAAGQSVRACAEAMARGPVTDATPPEIAGGKRHVVHEAPGPRVVCLDAAPMLEPADAGAIVITGSHAALFRGRPDDVVKPDVAAIFFSDGGVGKDQAGITRLRLLDERGIPAGAASADSAPIGYARAIYADGVLSHVNATAAGRGIVPGMTVRAAVDLLRPRDHA